MKQYSSKKQKHYYLFDQERFEKTVGNNHVNGTSMCLEISKIKIYTRVTDEFIRILEKAYVINPKVVYKFHDSYIIQGWCIGNPRAEMHTVIMKDKEGNWIRGTRADEPYKAYKIYRKLLNDPVSENSL